MRVITHQGKTLSGVLKICMVVVISETVRNYVRVCHVLEGK